MRYAVSPAAPVTLPVTGAEESFPVRRIYCVGRNYAAHIREMGKDPDREPPFFFMKPGDAAVCSGAVLGFPAATRDLQHEVELVLAIGSGGLDIPVESAAAHVYGQAVGVDLTRRDLQLAAREAGRPWEAGKSFDRSAPCGAITPCRERALLQDGAITLAVNGRPRQSGDVGQMIWRSAEIIARLSGLFRLEPGDLIFTGTPAGIGSLVPGDEVTATISGLEPLAFSLAK